MVANTIIQTVAIGIFFVGLALTILGYIVCIIRFIVCHKKHDCKNTKCPLWHECSRASHTEARLEEIRRLKIELQKYRESLQ